MLRASNSRQQAIATAGSCNHARCSPEHAAVATTYRFVNTLLFHVHNHAAPALAACIHVLQQASLHATCPCQRQCVPPTTGMRPCASDPRLRTTRRQTRPTDARTEHGAAVKCHQSSPATARRNPEAAAASQPQKHRRRRVRVAVARLKRLQALARGSPRHALQLLHLCGGRPVRHRCRATSLRSACHCAGRRRRR